MVNTETAQKINLSNVSHWVLCTAVQPSQKWLIQELNKKGLINYVALCRPHTDCKIKVLIYSLIIIDQCFANFWSDVYVMK